jgi:hypothetical protein
MSPSILRQASLGFAAALLAVAGAASAAEPAQVEVKAGPLRGLFAAESEAAAGVFQMSDGRLMTLRPRHGSVRVDLEGEPINRLLASTVAGGWVLRSPDGRMLMKFTPENGGAGQHVVVTLFRGDTQVALAAAARR